MSELGDGLVAAGAAELRCQNAHVRPLEVAVGQVRVVRTDDRRLPGKVAASLVLLLVVGPGDGRVDLDRDRTGGRCRHTDVHSNFDTVAVEAAVVVIVAEDHDLRVFVGRGDAPGVLGGHGQDGPHVVFYLVFGGEVRQFAERHRRRGGR